MTDPTAFTDVHTSLRSDPPWLRLGIVAVTLASVLACALYYRSLGSSHPPLALSLLPAAAMATFGGALLAWWGRRRGGSLSLETSPRRVVLQARRSREELIDCTRPFGAMLVSDAHSGARALVVSQQGEPTVLFDPGASVALAPPEAFADRTVNIDLGHLALSPDSAHVITPSLGIRMDPVLGSLAGALSSKTDWLHYPLPSGEVLHLTADGLRIGDRVATLGKPTVARRIAIQSPTGEIVALSIVCEENSFLLACQDVAVPSEGVTPVEAPDAYLPVLVWTVIASRFGVQPGVRAVAGAGDPG